jgi:hypothetical protein
MSTSIRLEVNSEHIRVAQRSHGRWTPVDIAVLRQTSYLPVGMLDDCLQLMDERGVEFSCAVSEALRQFLEHYAAGQTVRPAQFELACEAT